MSQTLSESVGAAPDYLEFISQHLLHAAAISFSSTVCSLLSTGQIPVFKGAAKPILGKSLDAGLFHGVDGLGDAPDPSAPGLDLVQEEGAVSAVIRIVNENPGEVRAATDPHCICSRGELKRVCSPGVSGGHSSAHQPGSGREDGSVSAEQTSRPLHNGRQH